MGLFGRDYESAGVGIAKNAPKKKGFFRYMELFGRKFWKMLSLNLLYSLFYLPVVGIAVTLLLFSDGIIADVNLARLLIAGCAVIFAVVVGPATAGHTKILRNYVLEKPSFMLNTFFKTFRSEFKYSCLVGILDCAVFCSIAAAMYIYPQMIEETDNYLYYFLFAITLSVGLVLLMMNFYMFLLIVSTTLSLKNVLKNSFSLVFIAMKKNVITLLILAAFAAVFGMIFIFAPFNVSFVALAILPFLPASWMGLVICLNCYPIIQKYIINPYYEQRGEVNPELMGELAESEGGESGEALFEDMGGKEQPMEKKKAGKQSSGGTHKGKQHKGKIIS